MFFLELDLRVIFFPFFQTPDSPQPQKDKPEAEAHSPDSLEESSRGQTVNEERSRDQKVKRTELPELIMGYTDNRLPSRISFETPM
jgi:hypothetical protein